MKYLSQFLIILGFTLAGELLQRVIPLPVPASVYGLALLFLALCTGVVKLPQIKETASFLTSILSVLFVAPAVGIALQWELIRPKLLVIALIVLLSTVVTFGISGRVTQFFLKKGGKNHG